MKSTESREMLEGRLLKIQVKRRKNDLNWIEPMRVSKPTTKLVQ